MLWDCPCLQNNEHIPCLQNNEHIPSASHVRGVLHTALGTLDSSVYCTLCLSFFPFPSRKYSSILGQASCLPFCSSSYALRSRTFILPDFAPTTEPCCLPYLATKNTPSIGNLSPKGSLPGSSRTEALWVPWMFRASQLSQRPGPRFPRRVRELLAQGPSELEAILKEALLLFPSSSPSPSLQRREGTGQAKEEQLQCRPSASQEQEGLDIIWGGSVGKEEKGQQVAPHHRSQVSHLALTVHREAQRDSLGTQLVLCCTDEFSFMFPLDKRQFQHPGF